jgi:hypothetical protein
MVSVSERPQAPKGRQHLAMDVSPWSRLGVSVKAPKGRQHVSVCVDGDLTRFVEFIGWRSDVLQMERAWGLVSPLRGWWVFSCGGPWANAQG